MSWKPTEWIRNVVAKNGGKAAMEAVREVAASIPELKMEDTGLFQGKLCKHHPAVQCGKSIIDKSFAIEFRTPRKDVSVVIGDKCILKSKLIFETDTGLVKIGDGCYLGSARIISAASVEIGNWVTMAWDITIYDHNSHSLDHRERIKDQEQQLKDWSTGNFIKNKNWDVVHKKPIKIGDYAWLGFGVTVLKGVTIGEGAIVGACSVVYKDVKPWTIVAGNPARELSKFD